MTVPIESLGVIQEANFNSIREHLDRVYLQGGLLTPDVSNYAKGRQRCWLQAEAPLGSQPWQLGVSDDRLWSWIKKVIWPEAELGLITYGPVGITLHRDASYADYEARTLNLGTIKAWQYEPGYSTFGYGPQNIRPIMNLMLSPGEVIRFNCKNRHGVVDPAQDRWAINLWKVSAKTRSGFESVLAQARSVS